MLGVAFVAARRAARRAAVAHDRARLGCAGHADRHELEAVARPEANRRLDHHAQLAADDIHAVQRVRDALRVATGEDAADELLVRAALGHDARAVGDVVGRDRVGVDLIRPVLEVAEHPCRRGDAGADVLGVVDQALVVALREEVVEGVVARAVGGDALAHDGRHGAVHVRERKLVGRSAGQREPITGLARGGAVAARGEAARHEVGDVEVERLAMGETRTGAEEGRAQDARPRGGGGDPW